MQPASSEEGEMPRQGKCGFRMLMPWTCDRDVNSRLEVGQEMGSVLLVLLGVLPRCVWYDLVPAGIWVFVLSFSTSSVPQACFNGRHAQVT